MSKTRLGMQEEVQEGRILLAVYLEAVDEVVPLVEDGAGGMGFSDYNVYTAPIMLHYLSLDLL